MVMELNKIYCMDAIEFLKKIDSNSINLFVVDSPYYRVMLSDHNGKKYSWDNQWKNLDDYLQWVSIWLNEIYRVLKHNGSVYLFCDNMNVSYVHIETNKIGFFLENNIVWVKPNNMPIKGWNRFNCYAPVTERILFCSKEHRTHNLENKFYKETIKAFSSIIEYMKSQKEKVKKIKSFKTDEEFNTYVNNITNTKSVVSRHYFTYSQWVFPTKELYERLQTINNEVFQKEYEVLKKEYEVLKKEYEVLKKEYETLLRIFHPTKNYTDVWTFNITSSKEKTFHPTQKPLKLIERIIKVSSNPGNIVLDPFMGSGTTAVACKKLERNFIGCEISQDYVDIANARLQKVVSLTNNIEDDDIW